MIPTDLAITHVEHIKAYQLLIEFNNGKQQRINFEHFLINHHHPDIQKYCDIELFKSYSITNGDLEWNDYELCFPISDLYENSNIESAQINVA